MLVNQLLKSPKKSELAKTNHPQPPKISGRTWPLTAPTVAENQPPLTLSKTVATIQRREDTGNRPVREWVRLQRKLSVGAAGDVYEREADRVMERGVLHRSAQPAPIKQTTPPSSPAGPLSVRLGGARGCGSGPDFAYFDFPSISAASTAKLAAWAASHPPLPGSLLPRSPFRSSITNGECEIEMSGVLTMLAGIAGLSAFSRFVAGTGGTAIHGPGSTLGSMALASGSFLRTVAWVQANIEAQLATQASGGVLNPSALAVTPPATFFDFSDGLPLKAVIGGTQGEELFATGFTGSIPLRSYSIDLRFIICDDFGVDESDLYAPGLFAFWVLQHERSPTRYVPFINQLDLPVTVKGTF